MRKLRHRSICAQSQQLVSGRFELSLASTPDSTLQLFGVSEFREDSFVEEPVHKLPSHSKGSPVPVMVTAASRACARGGGNFRQQKGKLSPVLLDIQLDWIFFDAIRLDSTQFPCIQYYLCVRQFSVS